MSQQPVRSSTTTELPTQEDQIRNYRRIQAVRRNLSARFRSTGRYNRTLEAAVEPERQLEISRQRRANLVPAEVLYDNNRSTARHRVYQHYSERRILCAEDQQIELQLCNEHSYQELRNSNLEHIHLGLFMIRIHTLHRRAAGTNALVILRDTRWEGTRQIIGTMEVDLTTGTQLVYMVPDLITSIADFHNHIQVAVQTHGYEDWQAGESNLLITMAAVGRLSNTSYMSFRYNVQNVVEHLATNGVVAIPGEQMSMSDLQGRSWNLRPAQAQVISMPTRVAVTPRMDRSVSLRFESYKKRTQPARHSISVDSQDRETFGNDPDEEHFIRMFTQERWDTLGEPSGKYDYYVRYDAPAQTTPIEEITATGWDSCSDEEDYGTVRIEVQTDTDDDNTSTIPDEEQEDHFQDLLQVLQDLSLSSELQEKRGETHQIFKLSKEEEESSMDYPKFTAFVNQHKEEYAFPGSSTGDNVYNPPPEPVMGQATYPPAQQTPYFNNNMAYEGRIPRGRDFGEYYTPNWSLPPAYMGVGVMLVLPTDPGLWDDVISRWESITINKLNEHTWADNKSKLVYVENLLGETEKKMWQQWRMAYPEAYTTLENISDDPQNITSQVRQIITLEDPYRGSTEEQDRAWRALERLTCEKTTDLWSFLDHFRLLAVKSGRLYFPSTMEKFFSKMPQPFSKRIEEAFRAKYPGVLAGLLPAIKFTHTYITDMCRDAALQKELRNLSICSNIPIPGVYQPQRRGKYGLRRSRSYKGKPHDSHLKVFKNKYKNDRGKVRKCKCFVCGKEGHFARDCRSKVGNMARASVLEDLYQELGKDYDVVSADQDDSSVCSYSEGEVGATAYNLGISIPEESLPTEESIYMVYHDQDKTEYREQRICMFRTEDPEKQKREAGPWKPTIELPVHSKTCNHDWHENEAVRNAQCYFCRIITSDRSRLHCAKCELVGCALCAYNHLGKRISIKKIDPIKTSSESSSSYPRDLIEIITKQNDEFKQSMKDQAKEYYEKKYEQDIKEQKWILKEKEWELKELRMANENKELLEHLRNIQQEKENLVQQHMKEYVEQDRRHKAEITARNMHIESLVVERNQAKQQLENQKKEQKNKAKAQSPTLWSDEEEVFDRKGNRVNAFIEEEVIKNATGEVVKPRRINNQLYNVTVEFDIPGIPYFTAKAILDTGATACCINQSVVPKEALEELKYTVNFNGLNSRQPANYKIKPGNFRIEGEKFKLPLVYCLEMKTGDGIDMLIGTNFTRAMKGGIRIEGDEITIYKKVTRIKTNPLTEVISMAIEELEMDEEMYMELQETIFFTKEEELKIKERFRPIIADLKNQGYIGDQPLKHWQKNKIVCKLEIINPDVTIQDKPLKHVTPALEAAFKKHIEALLELGVIRPSKSRHRTMAMIVNSGTTVDPITGKEAKGKERMVFNYRTLNDNTYKDQYSLPGINTLLKRIGNAKIFSKFDLKSGFHQVAMSEESVPWTAFLVPGGLYEWLVMPFGLKNAPAIFQRKMDECFKGTEAFIAVYIDDILVFSENEKSHCQHLQKMLNIARENGLVLSPTKMKIATHEVEFLGAVIGDSKIKLQPHIIKKIVDFDEEKLKSKTGMRSFLGILNYARNYIPKLGILTAPLHEKTNPHGDKRMKPSDYELVREIKRKVQSLPDLEIPPEDAYIILETDGCIDGWGGICKWKEKKNDSMMKERVCAYASGKFKVPQSTIDSEINACINTMEKLKIYYLDKKEITLRTDCQAIISFYNKTNSNKASRVRWLRFADIVTGTGVKINIEHIDGKKNVMADALSRMTNLCFAGTNEDQEIIQNTVEVFQEIQEEKNEDPIQKRRKAAQILLICENKISIPRNPNWTSPEETKSNTQKAYFTSQKKTKEENPYLVLEQVQNSQPYHTKTAQKKLSWAETLTKNKSPIRSPESRPKNPENKEQKPKKKDTIYRQHPIHGWIMEDSSESDQDIIVDAGWADTDILTLNHYDKKKKKNRVEICGARRTRL